MKITNIHCRVMGVPGPGGNAPSRNWIFVFVETDVGISGVGEATTEWHELAVKALVEQHLQSLLVGQDPTRIEHCWQQMYRSLWWRGGVVASSAISGVDQALWDITGKAYKLPVYKLLGGPVRDRVRLYARSDLGLANYTDEARAAVDEGFEAFKAGPGAIVVPFHEQRQVDVALHEFHRLRKVVGDNIELLIDCAGCFSVQSAAQLIGGLRQISVRFVEEPVNADIPRGLIELRRAFPDVQFAAGERLCTRWAYREWLEQGAVDVLQADVSHTGGISELIKIAHAAETYNVPLAPHNPYGPVALAASAHVCSAINNFLILEHCRLRPWFDSVQRFGPLIRQGHVELDDRPGLGVELNETRIEQNGYRPLTLRRKLDRYGATQSV